MVEFLHSETKKLRRVARRLQTIINFFVRLIERIQIYSNTKIFMESIEKRERKHDEPLPETTEKKC